MNDTDEEEKVTVNKVCQDFRVREDGELANKLQEEEFQKHYGMNRNERKSVRTDVRVAKQTYLEEIRTAQLLPEDELSKMEETDKWLAKDLQDKLHDEERKEIKQQQEIESHDAKVARQLQIREKEKFDREWRRKKDREEEERRHLQRTMEELNPSEREPRRRPPSSHVSEPIPINGHTDGVQKRVRRTNSKEDKRRSTGSGSSGGSVGKEERRHKHSPDYGSGSSGGSVGKEERRQKRSPDYGNGAVVALPPPENGGGGRLESDRIIMADGTAIDLFDNEEDKQKARKLQRVKKDEEYAKMLQDQERRIVEVERMAAEDRRLAMEEQDREFARHLQRKEYQRLKREQKERQMQRANSVPSDRHSMSIEDPRRLPSYEEAVHRNQLPDLLPNHDFDPENLHERDRDRSIYSSTRSSRSTASQSPPIERRTTNPDKVERREYTREDGRISSRGPSSADHRSTASQSPPTERRTTNPDKVERREYTREDGRISSRGPSQSPPTERRTTNPDKVDRREYTREDGRISSRGTSSADHRRSAHMDDRRSEREYGRSRGREHREHRAQSPTRNGHPSRDYKVDSNEHRKGFDNIEKGCHRYDEKEAPVWLTRDSVCSSNSPPRERHEYPENNHGSSRSSYASSGQSSCDRRSQTSGHAGSPSSRADVWERFDDDESFVESRHSRPSRSRTVASSHPTHYERERPKSYNVVENIDPTFKRERKGSEDDAKDQNPEEKAKVIPLIKPHRRKSAERKRDRNTEKENCKQQ